MEADSTLGDAHKTLGNVARKPIHHLTERGCYSD